jgi:hypothetical protein
LQVLLVLFLHSFYDVEWALFHLQPFDVCFLRTL